MRMDVFIYMRIRDDSQTQYLQIWLLIFLPGEGEDDEWMEEMRWWYCTILAYYLLSLSDTVASTAAWDITS